MSILRLAKLYAKTERSRGYLSSQRATEKAVPLILHLHPMLGTSKHRVHHLISDPHCACHIHNLQNPAHHKTTSSTSSFSFSFSFSPSTSTSTSFTIARVTLNTHRLLPTQTLAFSKSRHSFHPLKPLRSA